MKRTYRLTDIAIRKAKPKLGANGLPRTTLMPDGNGLYAQINPSPGGRFSISFVFRSATGGKEHRTGLGGYPATSLIQARELAEQHRAAARSGVNPLEAKRQRQAEEERVRREKAATEARAVALRGVTFKEAAEQYIAGQKAGWSNATYRAQWAQSLRDYAYPVLGDVSCTDITHEMVLQVLESIWTSKTRTASDLRGRVENILGFAATKGWRSRDAGNPASWHNNLQFSLASPNKLRPVVNHPALPYANIPEFMSRLRADPSVKARALEFVILTASRLGEVLGVRFGEIDFKTKVWTVPASRMKGRRDHSIPLSDRAIAVLMSACGDATPHPSVLVFTNRRGMRFNKMDLIRLTRQIWPEMPTATLHGMRSTFRDWCGDETDHPREVAEAALAHKTKGVEGAYRRQTALAKRRLLMIEWSQFCNSSSSLQKRAAAF
jgi:integrase